MLGSGNQVPFDVHTEGMTPGGVNPELHWKVRVDFSPLPLTVTSAPLSGGRGSSHWTI